MKRTWFLFALMLSGWPVAGQTPESNLVGRLIDSARIGIPQTLTAEPVGLIVDRQTRRFYTELDHGAGALRPSPRE